jgi:hypothetical protein
MNSSSCLASLFAGGRVHRQAGQEGPDDPLQVDRLGRHGGDGDQEQHEGELPLLGGLRANSFWATHPSPRHGGT